MPLISPEAPDKRRYLTGPMVWQRYAISDVSLWRWLQDPTIAFPQPKMLVGKRRYWLESDLLAWERSKSQGGDANKRKRRKAAVAQAR